MLCPHWRICIHVYHHDGAGAVLSEHYGPFSERCRHELDSGSLWRPNDRGDDLVACLGAQVVPRTQGQRRAHDAGQKGSRGGGRTSAAFGSEARQLVKRHQDMGEEEPPMLGRVARNRVSSPPTDVGWILLVVFFFCRWTGWLLAMTILACNTAKLLGSTA